MPVALSPSFAQHSPRHAFWLCMVVLLIWSTSAASAKEEYRRVYKMKNIQGIPLKDMADGMKRCADWVGGELAIADTLEKQKEIEAAGDLYRAENGITHRTAVMLGGSLTDKGCDSSVSGLPGRCTWCWDYWTGNCGTNNESLIGTGLHDNFKVFDHHYANWMMNEPTDGFKYPYIYLYSLFREWYTGPADGGTELLCVVKEPITDSQESSSSSLNVSLEEPTAAPSGFTKWWAILVIIVGLLVIAAIVITIVCCFCCGAGAPVEEEYKSEDDDGSFSVRDTQSNRSFVSGGGSMRSRGDSMRSMGSRRSSVYSASQCDSQDDMDDYNSYGDDRVSQGRSADSYYY